MDGRLIVDDGSNSGAGGFPKATAEDWRALVDKTLEGAPFDRRLVTRLAGGLEIQPLYTAETSAPPLPAGLRARPTESPGAWDLRASVDHPDPSRANAEALEELEGGAASLLVRIDPAGRAGAAAVAEEDLERILEGVYLDLAPVALDAGFLGPEAAEWLCRLAQARTLRPRLHLHLDPLGAFAEAGRSPGPMSAHLTRAARAACGLEAETAFLATGRPVHEAGGAEADEIAFMAAAGLAYVKAMVAEGLSMPLAVARVHLGLCADADYFLTIAKIRAARLVWARIAGALAPLSPRARLEVRSSRRMLSALDPWVNMLRLTAAGFGAGAGGADAVVLDAFTQPLGRPTPFARRHARNQQHVLMQEARLGLVDDPAGGAWYLESLTDQLAVTAWSAFQAIEGAGGLLRSLESGGLARAAGEVRDRRRADVARRKTGLVGVTEFPNPEEPLVEIDPVDFSSFAKPSPLSAPDGPDGVCSPLLPWRASGGFERLRARAAAAGDRPKAYLALLGTARDHSARAGFARNLLAAGGIEAEAGPPESPSEPSCRIAILCGSDSGYETDGPAAARTLKAGGDVRLYLAGRPGPAEAALRSAGIDEFLYAGCDVEAVLAGMLDLLVKEARP